MSEKWQTFIILETEICGFKDRNNSTIVLVVIKSWNCSCLMCVEEEEEEGRKEGGKELLVSTKSSLSRK